MFRIMANFTQVSDVASGVASGPLVTDDYQKLKYPISILFYYFTGNDMLHRMSSVQSHELRVDMESFNGKKVYAVYSNFSVGDEASKYKLGVNGYSGNAGEYTIN